VHTIKDTDRQMQLPLESGELVEAFDMGGKFHRFN
jgi:hypothetical protein